MQNKAIYILKTFSEDDVKRFQDFLNSPYFNHSNKLSKLYNALIKFYPDFNSKFLSQERLSKRVNPEIAFNRTTMHSLFFDLYHCAEKYLLIRSLEENPIKSYDLQRSEFFKRKLYKLINKNINTVRNDLDSDNNINADYYLNMFHLYTDICNLETITSTKLNKVQIKNKFEGLIERGKYVTYFFVTEMIRGYENLLTHHKSYNSDEKMKFISDIFEKIDFPELLKVLILNTDKLAYSNNLNIYLALFMAFSNIDSEKYYFEYRKILFVNFNLLCTDEKRFHIGRLIRYCMMKREVSDSYNEFNYELFNVYEFILKNKIFISSVTKYIPVELYRSILLHSLRLKKYKWTINFIKKYSQYIDPKRRKNIYYFSIAEYYFQRKMFKDARYNLHKIIFDEFIYKLDYKNLMLIIFFEMKEYESALDLINSYRHFLAKDNTLSIDTRKKHKNFINIVQSLVHFKTSTNKISTYHIEIQFDYDLPYSNWIKEKISNLDIKISKAI